MVLGLLLAATATAAGVGLLALSGWFIASAALAGLAPLTAHLFNLFHPSVGVRLFAITRTAARYGERIVNHEVTFRILERLRTWFYLQIEPLAPAGLARFRSGDVLDRIVADIDALDNLYIRVVTPGLVALGMTVMVVGLFWRFDRAAALTLLTGMVLAGLALPLAANRGAALPGQALARQGARLRTLTVEGLQGLAELLIFDAAGRHRGRIQRCQRDLIRVQSRMSHISGLTSAGLTLLSGGTVGIVLFVGAGRVGHAALDGPAWALLVFAALAAFEIVWTLPTAFQFLSRTQEAARRLTAIVDQKPPVHFAETSAAPAHSGVRFEKVSFGYEQDAPPVLEAFDLRVEPGERVAIMGSTGAGKSTLIHLLVRFWDPQKGRILLGDQDIRGLSEAALRRGMAVVSQQSHLFNATLRDNLLLACPEADDQRLWSALAKARLADFAADLPNGLDTWIGESGQRLSGGEARRLAVARSVLQDAPLWLLDEPTEGLDATNERLLMETLITLTAQRTLLLITHRPAALAHMDRIAVMEKGRIVEEGTPQDLLNARGRYAQLWRQRR
jgi:ATP-binding cassette subfamily C protein CydC